MGSRRFQSPVFLSGRGIFLRNGRTARVARVILSHMTVQGFRTFRTCLMAEKDPPQRKTAVRRAAVDRMTSLSVFSLCIINHSFDFEFSRRQVPGPRGISPDDEGSRNSRIVYN